MILQIICLLLFYQAGSWAITEKHDNSIQQLDSLIEKVKLTDKSIIIRMGYDAVAAIETQKGIVVIDAGISKGLTAKYRRIIENEFKNNHFAYLINTHGHPDHTGGNNVFNDVAIIGHENCPDEILYNRKDPGKVESSLKKQVNYYDNELQSFVMGTSEWNNAFCQKTRYEYAYNELLDKVPLTIPTIIFNDIYNINMGDETFSLMYFGKAHSTSDILIHIPNEKILIVGDLFSKYGRPGFTIEYNQYLERWLKALEWIEDRWVDIDIVIDGHGQILSKEDLSAFRDRIIKTAQK
jgi:cyclase